MCGSLVLGTIQYFQYTLFVPYPRIYYMPGSEVWVFKDLFSYLFHRKDHNSTLMVRVSYHWYCLFYNLFLIAFTASVRFVKEFGLFSLFSISIIFYIVESVEWTGPWILISGWILPYRGLRLWTLWWFKKKSYFILCLFSRYWILSIGMASNVTMLHLSVIKRIYLSSVYLF